MSIANHSPTHVPQEIATDLADLFVNRIAQENERIANGAAGHADTDLYWAVLRLVERTYDQGYRDGYRRAATTSRSLMFATLDRYKQRVEADRRGAEVAANVAAAKVNACQVDETVQGDTRDAAPSALVGLDMEPALDVLLAEAISSVLGANTDNLDRRRAIRIATKHAIVAWQRKTQA